jgi:demethylmenaquinone methyltransferase/2-methoxy-6-polyprenyl-1,4-benzoquinol methylase
MQSKLTADTAAHILPDAASKLSKKDQVAGMFNDIADRYDFLNHFLSLGIDKGWRKKAIAEIQKVNPKTILDVATGTADLAIAGASTGAEKIIGIDIAEQMLEIGRKKVEKLNLGHLISLQSGDSAALPFTENCFDAITCAYGVRNFEHLEAGLQEMNRVLRTGGKLAILEFSHPVNFPIRQLYQFYFRLILPTIGKLVSKNNRAYSYLPESVRVFPEGKIFCRLLEQCGFKNVAATPLTFGITTLYTAEK